MFAPLSFIQNSLAVIVIFTVFQAGFSFEISAQTSDQYHETITIDPTRPARTFDPNLDLGAGIDGHDHGKIDELFSPANIKEMLSVGFKPITFRLRTELANDAWHWNPQGAWSDKAKNQGYWTSDSRSDGDISLSYGYYLPRRGNTIDQANNDGYSRIDDGDPNSFWKSDPYLDKQFTKEDNALHGQWVVVDLGSEKSVDAIRILWGQPFASEYEVQYGNIRDFSDISQNPPQLWHSFENGKVKTKTGGEVTTQLSKTPVRTQYLRVLLKQSSYTLSKDAKDVRDTLGFALREIYIGTLDESKHFADEVRHGVETNKQTNIFVSSTDPWHRATDIDLNTEHVGFDRLFKSGLTNDSPALIPVAVLYDTPENAAAEIIYLIQKGYKIENVEMGEEPDGQYITPEDYGALYIQWADAIHKAAPNIKLGGPSFQEIEPDTRGYGYEAGNPVWLERFIHYLEKHHRASDFSFFSFEWYPFDDLCKATQPQIAEKTSLLPDYINVFRKHGLKPDVPVVISEYGYSAFAAEAEVDVEGALFNADTVGTFLIMGGSRAYLYGYEPNRVEKEVACTEGNNMLFLGDARGNITYRTSTYFGAHLTMQEWLQPSGGEHKIYLCKLNTKNLQRNSMIAAYAVERPDQKWSVMLINRDPQNAWTINLRFRNEESGSETDFTGDVDLFQFSAKQYKWDAELKHPSRDDPPEHDVIATERARNIQLPPYSMTVLRGRIR